MKTDHKMDRNINQEYKTEQKDSDKFEAELQRLVKQEVLFEEPMAGHVTFRVGGPADYYVRVSDAEELKQVIALCRRCV